MKTVKYLNQYLTEVETGQEEIYTHIQEIGERVDVVDVIGVQEEKGRIYMALEVEYNEYCYLLHISFIDVWEFLTNKDDVIEVQDKFINSLMEALKMELGINGGIAEDVKEVETFEGVEALQDVVNYGVENSGLSHLIYNEDIQDFYNKHEEEVNNIVEEITGVTVWDATNDFEAFETLINNIGGIDSELDFEDCLELKGTELPYIVWTVWEHVAYEYLDFKGQI